MSGQTKMMFTAWINPSSVTATDKVILGNSSDGSGNGFTLRQSATLAGKAELVINNTGAATTYQSTILGITRLPFGA